MSDHLRVLPLLFLFLSGVAHGTAAQSITALSDSAFKAYLNNAWEKVSESGLDQNLQAKYADEFYEYYLQHPDTELGSDALSSAVTMWGNIGAADEFDEAVAGLDYDSDIWQKVIASGSNAYFKHEERTLEAYRKWLHQLKGKLTHPESKSEVLLWLARHYNGEGETEKTIALARELIEINANNFYVQQALGFQQEAEHLGVSTQAPDFTASTIDGKEISLSDFRGNVVLLEFWATWCGPCLPEIPHLKKLHSTYSDQDLNIIGISLDRDSTKLEAFIQEKNMGWNQIYQSKRWEDEIPKMYNIYMIPRSFLIGRDGTILAKDLKGEALKNKIAELLEN